MPAVVQAGGFEYPGAGARSLGRGGAYVARTDDPLSMLYNPAQLAALPDPQASVDLNWAMYEYCQTRRWEEGGEDRVGPTVCNDATALPVPNVGFATRLADRFGFGLGLIGPTAVNRLAFPNEEGTVYDPSSDALVPAPTRYSLVERDVLLLFPSVGVGVGVTPWLRFGLTFGWGLAHVGFTTTASALGGNDASNDIVTSLEGSDPFVPRIIASVHAEPMPGLDFGLTFMWTDDIKANGELDMRFGEGIEETLQALEPDAEVPESLTVENSRIESPQPWQLAFGARYGHRRDNLKDESEWGFGDRVDDKMATEVWDIELDVVYEHTSSVDAIRVFNPSSLYIYENPDSSGVSVPVPSEIALDHSWQDQVSVRLGGDYNAVPNTLALRGGLSFETKGVPDDRNQLDFRPAQRFGLHAGLTVRINRFDLSLSYAHFFEQTVRNRGTGALEQTVGSVEIDGDPQELAAPVVVNNGTFTSNYDVLALGLDYHF
ncbi:MAG: OmpP1/FadL family transporter [Myxococcota bacterium]